MNRTSGNVSSAKTLFPVANNNSKPNRKSFKRLSESSTVSSDRNSSAQSEEDARIPDIYAKPQVVPFCICTDRTPTSLSHAICDPPHEEQEQLVKKLKAQVKELRHKLRVLEESVDSKDYSLGTIAREKDRAMGEIRRLERSNKQLRQQLNDERSYYLEEKEKFCAEMTKYKKKLQEAKTLGEVKKTPTVTRQPLINQSLRWQLNNEKGDFADVKPPSSTVKMSKSQNLPEKTKLDNFSFSESQLLRASSLKSIHLYEGDDASLQMAALRTENAKLRSIICERDERNYELCLRFLRMKHYKNDIKSRFQDLENEYLQVIANLMDKIDEARQEFNFIIDQKFKRPLHSTNAMYLQLVQKNSRMAFENASLRLENQCLKKELNKYANGVSDCDRKLDQRSSDYADVRLSLKDSNSDGKLKRSKKNVNFKEIRTIYDRGFAFKNSDTDSNYMSKTSTTVPSNRSLPDAKSIESVVECEQDGEEKASTSFQASSLPENILKKIFKRIDTPSSQTIESVRSKGICFSEVAIKGNTVGDTPKEQSSTVSTDVKQTSSQSCDKKKPKEEAKKTDNEPTIIEHKSPPKLTDSSSICDSKESVELKEFGGRSSYSPTEFLLRMDDTEKENFLDEKTGTLRNCVRERIRLYRCENLGESIEEEMSGGGLLKRNRLGRHERIHQSNQEREFLKRCSRKRMQEIKDCCGLQEKSEISDKELPIQRTGESESEKSAAFVRNQREKAEGVVARIDLKESEDEDEGTEVARLRARYIPPAVGSRSKSSNKLNLQDELMDALRNDSDCGDPTWKAETKSKSSTNSIAVTENITSVTSEPVATEVTCSKKTEGSKRFSHRLISTSPETLRHILTDSQLGGSYRMGPFIVSHASTEINSSSKTTENSNRIFLQLVIPKSTIEQSSQAYASKVEETIEKATLEKETSMSELVPVKSTARMKTPSSGVPISISNLPTSNSTMEIIESAVAKDRSEIMLRTLSAPGLLESDWLDQYAPCEMKDSSTNT